MALVRLNGGGMVWPDIMAIASAWSGFSTATVDAANKYYYVLGDVWWPDRTASTKTITHVHFRVFGTPTINAASQFRVSLQDVNLANSTVPARPDLVVDQQYTYAAGVGPTSDWNRVALTTSRTVTRGDSQLAVVFDWAAFTAASSVTMFVQQQSTNSGMSGRALARLYNGSSFSGASGFPAMVFEFSDGTYGSFDGTRVGVPGILGLATSSPEYALRFTPQATMLVDGVMLAAQVSSLSANFAVTLYENTTALKTLVIDASSLADMNSDNRYRFLFDQEVQLTAGTTYYVGVRGLTATSLDLGTIEAPTTITSFASWIGPNAARVQRANGTSGSWGTVTTLSYPMIGLLISGLDDGAGSSLTGSNTISGTVTLNGSPVSGATVRLVRQTDNVAASTTTNAQGQYSFSVASGHVYHAIAEWTNSGQKYNAKSLWDLTPVAP